MSSQVSWMLELDVQEGRENDLRALIAEMVNDTQANQPGTLDYEWSISADGKHCHLFERYVDSAAALVHIGTFGKEFAGRFFEVLKLVRMVIYGSPDHAVQEALANLHPVYMPFAGGFSR
jgi:quinol monooxygenase YgiN